jgi:hypothetical protein
VGLLLVFTLSFAVKPCHAPARNLKAQTIRSAACAEGTTDWNHDGSCWRFFVFLSHARTAIYTGFHSLRYLLLPFLDHRSGIRSRRGRRSCGTCSGSRSHSRSSCRETIRLSCSSTRRREVRSRRNRRCTRLERNFGIL